MADKPRYPIPKLPPRPLGFAAPDPIPDVPQSDIARALALSVPQRQDGASVAEALASAKYGLRPFDPKTDKPQDVGLGGPSTEYISGAQDPWGNEFNFPRIWWMNGKPVLLSPDEAYEQALKYEAATGQMFPRYRSPGASSFAAQNRSALGGAETAPLTSLWPAKNF